MDYYERQAARAEAAARILVMLWLFFSGAAAGWVGHMVLA